VVGDSLEDIVLNSDKDVFIKLWGDIYI
jgi:hypothetical protein